MKETLTRRRRYGRAAIASAAVASMALFAACSPSSEGDGGSGGEADEGNDLGGTVTALINPEQNRGFELFTEGFTEETGVEMDIQFVDSQTLTEQLRIQITSGTAPDLFRSSVGNLTVGVPTLAGEGYLHDLSDQEWVENVPDSFMPLIEDDGGVYAYPTSGQAILMFYNKSVFEEVGVDAPATWDEFIDISEQIRDSGTIPISLGLGEPAYVQFIPYILAATLVSGGEEGVYERMDAGETSFVESEGWNETFEKFLTLINSGLTTPDPLGMPGDQSMQAVATGEAAMIPLVSSNLPALAEYFPNGVEDVGVFAIPATNNAEDTWVPFSPDLLSVNADAENLDGALAFIDYIATPERASEYAEATSTLPALVNAEPVESELGETLAPYLSEQRAAPFSVHRWPNSEVQQVLLQSGQLVVSGEITVTELLERMDEAYALGVR